ncbi:putative amino-acid racemase [Corynebacterium occultum]|uniref:Putative amino-acid racemase n=1 Tax=Corynebacterium occultum TaxID=2675219 RepID=A0A6B8W3V8_9CORY|nr:amino acid racemase [Corynebacterium occultum]QGU06095.1 putative amino-acid racemase [Corynebacterium occultum]
MSTPTDKAARKIGLIGGTGPESTLIYYQRLIKGVQEKLGPEVVAPMVIENLSAFEVFRFLGEDDREGALQYLLAGVRNLQAAGAEFGALTANTTHLVFEQLAELSPIPLISSIDSTVRAVKEGGHGSVALLGTEFTMVNDFLSAPLRDAGVHVAIPDTGEIAFIQQRIAEELELGKVTEDTQRGFQQIVERLIEEEQIELVILACTELPLLFDTMDISVPTLDTIEPHVADLIEAITGK